MKKIFMLAFLCLQALVMSAQVYDKVDVLATYPGGEVEMYKYLAMNIKYPSEAAEQGIQGRIQVSFVVNADGSINDIKPIKLGEYNSTETTTLKEVIVNSYAKQIEASADDAKKKDLVAEKDGYLALIAESERVITAMPKWTPGKVKDKNGKLMDVDSRFVLPITFRLN